MAMWNMWWHFRFLFGQTNFLQVKTVFLNCLTEYQTSCLAFSICLIQSPLMPNKLSKPFLFSLNIRKILSSYTIPLLVLFVIFQLTVYYDCMVYHIIFLYIIKKAKVIHNFIKIYSAVSLRFIYSQQNLHFQRKS